MALTKTEVRNGRLGQMNMQVIEVAIGTYASNGLAVDPALFGFRKLFGCTIIGGNASSGGYHPVYDTANEKLVMYRAPGFTPAGTIAVTMTDGERITTFAPGGGDIKGATNPVGEATEGNTDQNAAPTNAALLLAETTFTVLAGTMTPTTQPDVPRNVMITIHNDSGGPLDLFEGVTTFAITGTDVAGNALTESVTLTSSAGNKSVANTKFRYVQGVKPFATVTSVAITNAPAGGLKGSLGIGTRIGLPTALDTAAAAEVRDITVSAARVAVTDTDTSAGGVDQTNNAVNVGTIADGADVGIIYAEDYDGQAGTATFTGTAVAEAALAEVDNGTNLASITVRLLGIGN